MSQDGEKLATTSEKGIQIRVFNTRTGEMLQEVRRGNEFANIYSLVFSRRADWLAVTSDSCNIHIFCVKPTEGEVLIPSLRNNDTTTRQRRETKKTPNPCSSS